MANPTRVATGPAPVKYFSWCRGGLAAIVYWYAGWFFSNVLFSGSALWPMAGPVFLALAWVVLLAGCTLGILTLVKEEGSPLAIRARWASVFVLCVLFAFHVKACLMELVEVSGRSMEPAFHDGDVVWIEKLSTGIQLPGLAFPFGAPSPTGKIPYFGLNLLQRGDVVVFRYPGVTGVGSDYFIKRVVGLPGDYYLLRNGRVYINGNLLEEPYLPDYAYTDARPAILQAPVYELPLELNLLDPDVKYSALFGAGPEGLVPAHTVFVMGDNRSMSRDSRSIGFVPTFFLLGRIFGQ